MRVIYRRVCDEIDMSKLFFEIFSFILCDISNTYQIHLSKHPMHILFLHVNLVGYYNLLISI